MRHFDGIARDLFSGDNINRNDGIQRDYYRFMVVEVEEKSGKDLTDYTVKASLGTIDWNSVKDNGDDIRIIQGNKELDRILENFSKVAKTGNVWFKVSAISANAKRKFLMLYGNQAADIPPSDRDKVYLFWDDFPGTILDPNKWVASAYASVSNGHLILDNSEGSSYALSSLDIPQNYVGETRFKIDTKYTAYSASSFGEWTSDRSYHYIFARWEADVDKVQFREEPGGIRVISNDAFEMPPLGTYMRGRAIVSGDRYVDIATQKEGIDDDYVTYLSDIPVPLIIN